MTDPASGPLCIDLDATLVTAHSESTAGTYKGGYGSHPLLAYLDRGEGTGEGLAGVLRPGNAGANTATDHIDVFESARLMPETKGHYTAHLQTVWQADWGPCTRFTQTHPPIDYLIGEIRSQLLPNQP